MGGSVVSEDAILLREVSQKYGRRQVLNRLSWSIPSGSRIGLVGANGSGKTTLLKVIAGFCLFDSGSAVVLGQRLSPRRHEVPNGLGVALEGCSLLPQISAFENLRMLSSLKGYPDDAKVIETLNRVGLDAKDRRRVREYSLGMRQRLNLAQALLDDPRLLLLDEPTNGLDPEGVSEFSRLIEALDQVTVIIATHRMDIAEALCDQVWELREGHLFRSVPADRSEPC